MGDIIPVSLSYSFGKHLSFPLRETPLPFEALTEYDILSKMLDNIWTGRWVHRAKLMKDIPVKNE